MDCLRSTPFRYIDNGFNLQVALCGWSWTDKKSLVSFSNMQSIAVGFRVNSHRAYSHFTACCNNANRYFTTVGDQYF